MKKYTIDEKGRWKSEEVDEPTTLRRPLPNNLGIWIFANPRSGSTLLCRLLRAASHFICTDTPFHVIQSFNSVHKFLNEERQYDSVSYGINGQIKRRTIEDAAEEGVHAKWWAGYPTKATQLMFFRGWINGYFGSTYVYSPSFKMTQMFLCPEQYEDSIYFYNMLVKMFLHGEYETIDVESVKIFLKRSPDKVAHSMWSIRERVYNKFPMIRGLKEREFKDVISKIIEFQNGCFKKIAGIGSVHIKYADLIKDPIAILENVIRLDGPSKDRMMQVMKTRTR